MTIKESILKTLDEIQEPSNLKTITDYILEKKYFDFGTTKNPSGSISSRLRDFIRVGDTRIKRMKMPDDSYVYYLTKNEQKISIDILSNDIESNNIKVTERIKGYEERDLHILLSSYLKNTSIYSKTIFHEQSTFGKDNNQTWTHPDMVSIRFLNLHTKASQAFMKSINKEDTFKISSYEIKKEISSDSELKKAFFQAVSNSSWANYGFLVAFEFSSSLLEEMERLNQSFGIGIIELNSNPYQSKILYPAKFRDLDFKTIDKLCRINKEFEKFIELSEKLMTAEERYYKSTERELDEFCDKYFNNDSEAEEYCKNKKIPIDQE